MQNPVVSVITVAYNAAEFIERTLKSVQEQSYPAVEYVVIDGKSTDGTLEIIEKYKEGVDTLVSEPDKSLYDAMNKGIDYATGDYIVFMNAGDQFYAPNALEKAMKGSNNADFIYGRTKVIAEDGQSYREWHKQIPEQTDLSAKSIIDGMVICHQAMIVKRSLAGHYSMDWKVSADIDWTIRVLKQVKTKHFYKDDYLVLYLDGGVSDKHRVNAVKERFKILKQHFGLGPTVLQQLKIGWRILRRGGRIKPS